MIQHHIAKQINVSLRGINDTSIEELYYFYYAKEYEKEFVVPHRSSLESVTQKALDFFIKDKNTKLLCFTEYFKSEIQKNNNSFGGILNRFSDFSISESDDNSFLFEHKLSENKYPILVKMGLKEEEGYFLSASSYDVEELQKLTHSIGKKFAVKSDSSKIYFGMIYSQNNELSIHKIPLNVGHIKNLNLELNYGKNFLPHCDKIIKNLEDNKNGIFIFHGTMGTGKSSFVKYLAKKFYKKRTFIFVPTNYINDLSSPSLIPVLLQNQNSVLVLEDAEKAVISRELREGNESMVATLLNIGDGILGSMLNLSIILTFNTKKEDLDPALLRKGRLLYEHEFLNLGIEDSQTLINTFKKDFVVKRPMSLADIYNLSNDNNLKKEEKERKIGFAQ
jgi:hypothetical protein